MKILPLFAAAVALAGAPALAQSVEDDDSSSARARMSGQAMMSQGMMAPVMIAVMDSNGDGALSLKEMEAVHARVFEVFDEDGDGELSRGEMGMAMHAKVGARGGKAKAMGSGGMMMKSRHMMGPMMIAMLDTNNDRALSFEEIEEAHRRMFNMIDSNEDGEVTPKEARDFVNAPAQ